MERKRREAVWELFRSECVFLINHLMALKHVRYLTYRQSLCLSAIKACPNANAATLYNTLYMYTLNCILLLHLSIAVSIT